MSRSECAAPELHETIVRLARRGGVGDDPKHRVHLATCDACRVEAERVRRMAEVWSGDGAGDGEVDAARLRFERRREATVRATRPSTVLAYAAAGAGLAVLLLVSTQRTRPRAPEVAAATLMTGSPPSLDEPAASAPHLEGPDGVKALSEGMRVMLAAGQHAKLVLGPSRPPVALDGPCVVEVRSAPGDVSGWRFTYVEGDPSTAPSAPPAPAPAPAGPPGATRASVAALPAASSAGRGAVELPATPAPSADRGWRETAEAMKRNDTAAADRALADLCRAPDHATRDAARLARAELWIQQGKGAAVKPVLVELAAHGATSLVKARAAQLLERVE